MNLSKDQAQVQVTNVEDRAGNTKRGRGEVHYGMVYFNDERRVGYSNAAGVVSGTANWLPITPTHMRLARAILESSGLVDSAFPEPETEASTE
jgi:hypothetical protein